MTAAVFRLYSADLAGDGVARVPERELERLLGPTASHVWQILGRFRDHRCRTHVTTAGIASARGFVRTAPRAVKKALVRLRAAGLVRDVGWTWLKVPERGRVVSRRVYVREVFGDRIALSPTRKTYSDYPGPEQEYVIVAPAATGRWAKEACGWGGKRPGAGRKKAMTDNQEGPPSDNQEGPTSAQSRGSTDLGRSKKEKVGVVLSLQERTARPREPVIKDTDVGVVLGSLPSRPPANPSAPLADVPPYPTAALTRPARVPSPPLLDPALPDLILAKQLLDVYRRAVERRTGKPCRVFARGGFEGSKYRKTLERAARMLIEHEIPPASWCLFMLDVSKDYVKRGTQRPTVPWVFAAAKIERWRGWFKRESAAYDGGRVLVGPDLKKLLVRYAKMRKELDVPCAEGRAAVVAKHFPEEDSYAQALEAARAEGERARQFLVRRVARGEILW